MFRNYLISALRSFQRHPWQAILNVIGLAIGLACSTLILMDIQYEFAYDAFHPKAERIYRVYAKYPGSTFRGMSYSSAIAYPAGPAMIDEIPEIENTVRQTFGAIPFPVRTRESESMETVIQTEASVLSVFDIPLVRGEPSTALRLPNSALISESAARRLFGNKDPVGEMIGIGKELDYQVTGVMKDLPGNSHVAASVYLSISHLIEKQPLFGRWDFPSFSTYVLLKEGSTAESLREKLPSFVEKHLGEIYRKFGRSEPIQYLIQPITDMHLGSSDISHSPRDVGDFRSVLILSALALVLLVSSSINYMNLTTARASLRAREVGIRKMIGASRKELIGQFLSESFATTFIAGVCAIAIAEFALPAFSAHIGRELPAGIISNVGFLPWFSALILVVAVVSGIYPAFALSSPSPIGVLKGAARGRARSSLRNGLVVIQFAATIGLAVSALVILDQLSYVRTTDLGYDRSEVFSMRIVTSDAQARLPVFVEQATRLSGVVDIATSSMLPVDVLAESGVSIMSDEGVRINARGFHFYANDRFLGVYQIPLLNGRPVSNKIHVSATAPMECIVNETFTRTFGLKAPIGKQFDWSGRTLSIVGVMKDFHLQSFRRPIAPLMISQHIPNSMLYMNVRIRPEGIAGKLEALSGLWKEVVGDDTFRFRFVDETFARMYESDEKLGQTVVTFTGLALFIGVLGLLGLATFVVQTRHKEISIRKVLGATSASVASLVSKEFMVPVLLSNIVAWPIAYLVMSRWLSDFAYRVSLSPGLFLLAGAAAGGIAYAAVSFLTIRSARTNPVESLRYE